MAASTTLAQTAGPRPSLIVHRSSRSDVLVDQLAQVLRDVPADPFMPDLIAVHSSGMQRWVSQQLSQRIGGPAGICANVAFTFPGRLVAAAMRAAGGPGPDTDPWQPSRLVWPIIQLLDAHGDADWLAPLRARMPSPPDANADAEDTGNRFGIARHIADLFDRYAIHRPNLVLDWHAGNDGHWQARLWRDVRALVDQPSPAERLDHTIAQLRSGAAAPDDLPDRVCLFGLTALPSAYMAVLGALAAVREVRFFLLHPSPALWTAATGLVAGLTRAPLPQTARRGQDRTAAVALHPLLASWGRDSREVQTVVQALGDPQQTFAQEPQAAPATLLGHLQTGIRTNTLPAATDRPVVAEDDRTIAVHGCHGRARQVQVVRDAILHLLADDPTLMPRDIVVMCPDVETFAPLITAVFGGREEQAQTTDHRGLPRLRVRLADRSLRATNPVLSTVARVLDLAGDRLLLSDVIDLASHAPVRRRFGFDDDMLERLERWARESGARWGMDAAHRVRLGIADVGTHTLHAALDRMLLGLAMPDDDATTIAEVTPLDHVEGSDAAALGRFAEFIDRLDLALQDLTGPQPLQQWLAALLQATDLLTATSASAAWQRQEVVRLLDEVRGDGAHAGDLSLQLAEIRDLLGDRLKGRPSWANHRTGDLTVCTLVPMRSVPHRVVCLLGMDDGAFPRRPQPSADDRIAAEPCIGDREERSEDRQLLLDAVLAATDHLIITYAAYDERSGAKRPACVPINELLDVLTHTAISPGATAIEVVRHHPLADFDPSNFSPDAPWSFDRTGLAAATALRGGSQPRGPFLQRALAPLDPHDLTLSELDRVLLAPVKQFLARRMGIWVADTADQPNDAIPIELDKLEEWAVGDQLVRALLQNHDPDAIIRVLAGRGQLGPGRLTQSTVAEVGQTAANIVRLARTAGVLDPPARSIDVDVMVDPSRRLGGNVSTIRGNCIVELQYSNVKAKHLLRAWIQLVALSVHAPEIPWEAIVVGRVKSQPGALRIHPISLDAADRGQTAQDALQNLIAVFDLALCEPLPLSVDTAMAYAQAYLAKEDVGKAEEAAANVWQTGRFPAEDSQPAHVLVYDGLLPIDELLTVPPQARDAQPQQALHPSRLGTLACRLWEPILKRIETYK